MLSTYFPINDVHRQVNRSVSLTRHREGRKGLCFWRTDYRAVALVGLQVDVGSNRPFFSIRPVLWILIKVRPDNLRTCESRRKRINSKQVLFAREQVWCILPGFIC